MKTRIALLLLSFALVGCTRDSAAPVRVWGDVSLNGQPIEDGEIVFMPAEDSDGPSTGGPIKAGRYDIPANQGPHAGKVYKVEISAFGSPRSYTPNVSGEGPFVEIRDNLVPPQFNLQTRLTVQIAAESDGNQHDFRLEP